MNAYAKMRTMGELAGGRIFGLDLQLLQDALILGINIFIIFILASYLLFNPVRALLKKRQEQIQNDLDGAARNREKANALAAEYEGKLAHIQSEAETVLEDARRRAGRCEAQILQEARNTAQDIRNRAEKDAALEREKALEDVKQEIIRIAGMMAGQIIAAQMDDKIQDSLVNEVLEQIGAHTWDSRG